jgi:exonuclease III
LEADIGKYSLRVDIMLMGDLNAHINCDEHDFIINDSDNILNNFLPNNYITDSVHVLRNTQVHQNTNNYGKSIIELCSDSQLRILNGRTLGDSVGKATYFNYSGVTINDYCICSASFLKNITSFHAGDFDTNLSDHCPITVKMLSRSVHYEHELALRPKPINIKWSKSVEEQFTANLSCTNFKGIIDNISATN